MFSKRRTPVTGEELPPPDEGWWASVLADEEVQPASQKDAGGKIAGQQFMMLVDWDRAQDVYDQDEIVTLAVLGYNRGGLLVGGEDLQGFVPISHLVDLPSNISTDEERRSILASYVGRYLNLKIIECEPDQERIVFSERAALAAEGRRKLLFQELHPGDKVRGTVTNVTDFGVFVDLGGLEGLIHVSELSWGRVQHPSDILCLGQTVEALVLSVSEENLRIALSIKRLFDNPWETITQRYAPGDVVNATVTGITRFGAFARLEEGVEGLIHVSSMNLPQAHGEVGKYLSKGQAIKVRILHIDADKRRLGLGLVSLE
jgi:small subunit ribosomal protein S1